MKRDYARERHARQYHQLLAAKERLNRVYHWRRQQAQTFGQHLAMLREFRGTLSLLDRQKEWLDGYHTAIREARENELVWLLYLTPENRFVGDDQVPKGRWSDVRGGAHVWRHRLPEIKIYDVTEGTFSAVYTLNAYPAVSSVTGEDGAVCPECYEVGAFLLWDWGHRGMGTWACPHHGHYDPPSRRQFL